MSDALVRPPSTKTLRSYGLDEEQWRALCVRQQWICPVCQKPFGDRKLVIDHEHVRGFKARKRRKSKKKIKGQKIDVVLRVMSPKERSRHVRGVLHSYCNRFVRHWLTLDRARSIVSYLEDFEARKINL